MPQSLLEKIAVVRKVYRTLPPPVSVEALAAATGFAHDDVVECLAAVKLNRVGSWEDLAATNDVVAVPQQDQPQHRRSFPNRSVASARRSADSANGNGWR